MATNSDGAERQTVADPEEFNQQRRLASIHDARDRARVAYEEVQDPDPNDNIEQLAQGYRAAVENYISELEGLARRYEFGPNEPDYWEDHTLGYVTIPLPQSLRQFKESDDVTVTEWPTEPERREVTGLQGYLDAPPTFQAQYTISYRKKHTGHNTATPVVDRAMPVEISYRAFRCANQFLALAGIGIELNDGGAERIRGFDQSRGEPQAQLDRGDYPEDPDL